MKNDGPIIEAQNLNKSFAHKPAVINLTLSVNRGEICGFLGPNGSGKTTTLRMLCGLLTPDSGAGHCLGYDILKESFQIKRHVGYMTQQFSLYHDLSTIENLDFIARTYQIEHRKEKISHFLEMFNLTNIKNQLTGSLSGGMKQRLALAGCLLHEPQLLLLDEPTAGVDPKVRREFWDEIHKLAKTGITTLVSTHYMDEAERCTKLIYIAYGNLLTQGTISEIIEQSQLHTWAVSGEDLLNLEDKLKKQAGIDQVSFFGNTLHVSGKNEAPLAAAIHPFQAELTWQKISPSLEDVFINLVNQAENKKT